mmetsp:Transcript_33099/g.68311  ORF Transcript_33099/g.68311 Transcript_33099/m.68311 type:complete len:411 (-) Transcript_33099:691-1923(-)|eukprot:CAMPEP_0181308984 /NCGR_PEP_ID=MMETSP1101-20121128/11771_1 /TAXON_ID=46948 /ORGANISM="Rhodomonas abbreviata, Strain Caron Lab Isolate" /LENGTH=410 /DNA_ID=CAMNT_0023415437 /DNA_START=241 /DNA_END=1473 /DNA_ORIENTATION=-
MREFVLAVILVLSLSHPTVGDVASSQQWLQMLSHFDGTVPPPAPNVHTETYNPVFSTADHARTWTPNYPTPYYYEKVDATFSPICASRKMPSGLYRQIERCDKDEMKDVSVDLTIEYAIIVGPKEDGVKSIGDAPEEDSPAPFVRSVKDGEGNELQWSLFRSEQEWFLHYKFLEPVTERAFYTVTAEFQLRDVMQGNEHRNTFKAGWLAEWNAPVKEMHVSWAFPRGFDIDSYDVEPSDMAGEGEGGQEGEVHGITSVCCGEEARAEDEMERCTADKELAKEWSKGDGPCADSVIVLSTHLSIPESEEEFGSMDDGVQASGLYKVSFEPGLVEVDDPAGVNKEKVQWWVWLMILLVIFPCIGAIIYTLGKHGFDNFLWDGWLDSCFADRNTGRDSSDDVDIKHMDGSKNN